MKETLQEKIDGIGHKPLAEALNKVRKNIEMEENPKAFSPAQITSLKAGLDKATVKTRKQGGRELSYIEGWHAIAEANRIFGFDKWTRQTERLDCVHAGETALSSGSGYTVTYIATVRITVCYGAVYRTGVGAGHGKDRDLGQAHESAIKEAETDAMKRALMTFGNPFGLALYDKAQTDVVDTAAEKAAEDAKQKAIADAIQWYESFKDAITESTDVVNFEKLVKEQTPTFKKVMATNPDLTDDLKARIGMMRAKLNKENPQP